MKIRCCSAGAKFKQFEKEMKECHSELDLVDKELEKLNREFSSIEDDALAVMKAFESAKNDLSIKEGELEAIGKKYEEIKHRLSVLEKSQREVKRHTTKNRKVTVSTLYQQVSRSCSVFHSSSLIHTC